MIFRFLTVNPNDVFSSCNNHKLRDSRYFKKNSTDADTEEDILWRPNTCHSPLHLKDVVISGRSSFQFKTKTNLKSYEEPITEKYLNSRENIRSKLRKRKNNGVNLVQEKKFN